MKILFAGQVAKDPLFPDANEDAIALGDKSLRIAISDGASESFDSKSWARLLVANFVNLPELNSEWLTDSAAEYHAKYDVDQMSWSKQASFERGNFASLLGVVHPPEDSTVEVLAVGDSLAVFLDNYRMIDSFPYKHSDDFQKRPELFCTDLSRNKFFFSPSFFTEHLKTWSLKKRDNPCILCMTDALGEWALRNDLEGQPVWKELLEIKDVAQLEELVARERQARTMKVDDTTLVNISF